ncbi:hypothetical protein MTBBW1_550003 [Desulfamplus magnetovallimortis]|uniref:Uncharacterized protein n=1 Tax=Desulfamplus magnetovallimortis TaxID=1246637 RepID=A0A1W1HHZ9_9BACT|nr:hypothetical protein MTBBW1_550003 [Desulfamplus magnetovallimortis]
MKVVYTFLMTNPEKWGFHLRKCKAGNETCPTLSLKLVR